jgi:hypothetical protein
MMVQELGRYLCAFRWDLLEATNKVGSIFSLCWTSKFVAEGSFTVVQVVK